MDYREEIAEPICEACMPYICALWDLKPKGRLEKCKPLRKWADRILSIIFTPEQLEMLEKGGKVAVTDVDQRVGVVLPDGYNKVETISRVKQALELANFRRVVV